MDFVKGEAVVGFPFQMLNKYGQPLTTGTVIGYITKDGGTQEQLSMVPVHEGNGQWSVNISATEMNADIIGLLFKHDDIDSITQHFTIKTLVLSTEDAYTYVPATSVGVTTVEDLTWNYYGTISRANVYFSKRLNTGAWDNAFYNDRESSLIMATRIIDRLNFAGDKSSEDQVLQFPRCDDTKVPVSIEYAAYEIALALLDGYNPDQEVQTLGVLSESYSGVRTTYDADYVNEHIRAGVPSIDAWEYLRPFLRDPKRVRLSRVS